MGSRNRSSKDATECEGREDSPLLRIAEMMEDRLISVSRSIIPPCVSFPLWSFVRNGGICLGTAEQVKEGSLTYPSTKNSVLSYLSNYTSPITEEKANRSV